jgi:small-conductance mechanosensitive channel
MDLSRQYTLELIGALVAIPVLLSIGLAVRRWLVVRLRVPLGLRSKMAIGAFSAFVPIQIYQWIVQAQVVAKTKGPSDIAVDGAAAPALPFLFPEPLLQALLALLIFFTAFTAVQLVRRYFWDGWFEAHTEAKAPKFLSDIGSACIIGVALLFIVTGVYHKDLGGLQLGSTVSVAVLGFASQDLLGNLMSGVALHIGSPFRRGDWLLIDQRKLQVCEVNWRSTRMRTPDNVLVDIPNKTIAGGTIVNLSAPTAERALSVVIGFDHSAEPDQVKRSLEEVARSVAVVMPEPAPRAILKEFGESAIQYEVTFWVAREEDITSAADSVRTGIWHEARRVGFRMPFPRRHIRIERHRP